MSLGPCQAVPQCQEALAAIEDEIATLDAHATQIANQMLLLLAGETETAARVLNTAFNYSTLEAPRVVWQARGVLLETAPPSVPLSQLKIPRYEAMYIAKALARALQTLGFAKEEIELALAHIEEGDPSNEALRGRVLLTDPHTIHRLFELGGRAWF